MSLKNHKKSIRNNKSILKHNKDFKGKSYNVFTEEINKVALSSNDDNRMQTYAYGTSKDLVSEKEEIKCNGTKKR